MSGVLSLFAPRTAAGCSGSAADSLDRWETNDFEVRRMFRPLESQTDGLLGKRYLFSKGIA